MISFCVIHEYYISQLLCKQTIVYLLYVIFQYVLRYIDAREAKSRYYITRVNEIPSSTSLCGVYTVCRSLFKMVCLNLSQPVNATFICLEA